MPELLPLYNITYYLGKRPVRISTESVRSQDYSHFHRHIQLCFVLSGELLHSIDGKEYLQCPGSLAFLPPYSAHTLSTVNSEDTPIIAHIWFNESFLTDYGYNFFSYKDFLQLEGKRIPLICNFRENADTAKMLVREMINEFEKGRGISYSKTASLIAELLRMSCTESCAAPSKTFLKQVSAVERSVDFIIENHSKKISLDDMSEAAGLPRRSFTTSFKKVTGLTPLNFLISVRLFHAVSLLVYSDILFEEIAAQTGLGDHATLARAFSKYLGMSPTEYRNAHFFSSRHLEQIPIHKRFQWLTEE